jgi:5-methylcytosine-specific restriction endonuclease McrA
MPWMKPTPPRQQPHGSDKRYNSRRWRKFRKAYLMRDPLCVDCGRMAQVLDHIKPVRLNVGLDFYDTTNMQPMCHQCHNAKRGHESHQVITYTVTNYKKKP